MVVKMKLSGISRSYRQRLKKESSNHISAWCVFLLLLLSSTTCASAFQSTTSASGRPSNRLISAQQPLPSSSLCALPGSNDNNKNDGKDEWKPSNLFESFKNLFGNNDDKTSGGESDQGPIFSQLFQPPSISSESYNDGANMEGIQEYVGDECDEEDELPAGTTMLFKIPARQLKPGGLRLFLMFYLMGMQNTPDRNTWRADQKLMSVYSSPQIIDGEDDEPPEEKQYVLEMLYDVDRTGMLQIELLPATPRKPRAEIRIYRCGSRPSTSYLMQESFMVDGILDELQNIAGEKDLATTIPPSDSDPHEPEIAEEDRLLITDPPNAIEAARESLAFS